MEFEFPKTVASAEDIPERYRPFYEEDEGGQGFKLADPVLARKLEEPQKVLGALEKERKRATELEKLTKKFRTFADDPDQLASKINQYDEEIAKLRAGESAQVMELKNLLAQKGDVGQQLEKVKFEVEQPWKKREQEWKHGLQERESKIARYKSTLERHMVQSAAQAAIAAAKGNVRTLLPHVTGQVKVIEDDRGEFAVSIVDKDGDVRYTSKGEPFTFTDLVNEMKLDPDFAMNFENSGSTGSGARGGSGGGLGGGKAMKTYSQKEWRALMSTADKKPEDGGYPGGRAQLMKDYTAGKIAVK